MFYLFTLSAICTTKSTSLWTNSVLDWTAQTHLYTSPKNSFEMKLWNSFWSTELDLHNFQSFCARQTVHSAYVCKLCACFNDIDDGIVIFGENFRISEGIYTQQNNIDTKFYISSTTSIKLFWDYPKYTWSRLGILIWSTLFH